MLFEYSDAKPKFKNVCVLDLSENKVWGDENCDEESMRIQQSVTTVEQLFQAKSFIPLSDYFFCNHNKLFQIYGRFSSGKLKECVAVQNEYYGRSLSPHFQKRDRFFDPRTDPSKTWHISRNKNQGLLLEKKEFMECSWNYIDLALHWMHSYIESFKDLKYPMESVFCERLYKKIRTKGLEKTLIRIAIVVNRNHEYSFNVVFDTKEEEEKGKKFLISFSDSLLQR